MLSFFKKKSIKSEFAKNALTLTIGTSIAQAFPIFFYPILGRIFVPSDFGLLATLTSITSILAVVGSARYESSILIAASKKEAANIVGLVLILSFSTSVISFFGLHFFSTQLVNWFDEPEINKWLFIPPISAFAIIIFKTYNEWCVRNKYFISLSWNKIINASATTLSKVALGLLKYTNNGLVVGDLIGRVISALGCIIRALITDKEAFLQVSYKKIISVAKQYKDFPKFYLPGSLIDVVNSQLPTFMIAAFFNSREVGFFAMAGSILSVPASVISVAVMDVFRQRANEEWVKFGNCINIYKKAVKYMFFIIVPVSIFLVFFLPDLFSIILGKTWYTAGIYARILLPNVVILFMFQVVSAIFVITNKMKASFIWQIYSITLTLVALYLGGYVFKDIKMTLICYVVARSIANLSRFYLTYKYAQGLKK